MKPTQKTDSKTTPPELLADIMSRFDQQDVFMLTLSDDIRKYSMQKRTRDGDDHATAKRVRQQGKEIIASIKSSLTSNPEHHAPAVWIVKLGEDDLKVVDGHHRLEGYIGAGREAIPAKIIEGTVDEAELISDLANTLTQTVPLTSAERSEIAWAALRRVHDGNSWPKGWSSRGFAKIYAVSSSQSDSMVKRLKELGMDEAKDLTWKAARFSGDYRLRDASEVVDGWVSKIDGLRLTPERMEVMAGLLQDLADDSISVEKAKESAIKALGGVQHREYAGWDEDDTELEF